MSFVDSNDPRMTVFLARQITAFLKAVAPETKQRNTAQQQRAIAEQLGVSPSLVSRLWKGERSFQEEHLNKLADWLLPLYRSLGRKAMEPETPTPWEVFWPISNSDSLRRKHPWMFDYEENNLTLRHYPGIFYAKRIGVFLNRENWHHPWVWRFLCPNGKSYSPGRLALVGPLGGGKTTWVEEILHLLTPFFEGRVFYGDLEIQTEEEILSQWLEMYEKIPLSEHLQADLLHLMKSDQRRALVVLENVIDLKQMERLYLPSAWVLVSTIHPENVLGVIPAEGIVKLAPFTLQESRKLAEETARVAGEDWSPRHDGLLLNKIHAALEGLPLGMRIAAGMVTSRAGREALKNFNSWSNLRDMESISPELRRQKLLDNLLDKALSQITVVEKDLFSVILLYKPGVYFPYEFLRLSENYVKNTIFLNASRREKGGEKEGGYPLVKLYLIGLVQAILVRYMNNILIRVPRLPGDTAVSRLFDFWDRDGIESEIRNRTDWAFSLTELIKKPEVWMRIWQVRSSLLEHMEWIWRIAKTKIWNHPRLTWQEAEIHEEYDELGEESARRNHGVYLQMCIRSNKDAHYLVDFFAEDIDSLPFSSDWGFTDIQFALVMAEYSLSTGREQKAIELLQRIGRDTDSREIFWSNFDIQRLALLAQLGAEPVELMHNKIREKYFGVIPFVVIDRHRRYAARGLFGSTPSRSKINHYLYQKATKTHVQIAIEAMEGVYSENFYPYPHMLDFSVTIENLQFAYLGFYRESEYTGGPSVTISYAWIAAAEYYLFMGWMGWQNSVHRALYCDEVQKIEYNLFMAFAMYLCGLDAQSDLLQTIPFKIMDILNRLMRLYNRFSPHLALRFARLASRVALAYPWLSSLDYLLDYTILLWNAHKETEAREVLAVLERGEREVGNQPQHPRSRIGEIWTTSAGEERNTRLESLKNSF